jgi:hypothetical protein
VNLGSPAQEALADERVGAKERWPVLLVGVIDGAGLELGIGDDECDGKDCDALSRK